MASLWIYVLSPLMLYAIIKILQIGSRDKRLPPGPPTVPILGNLHQIPLTGLHKRYACASSSSVSALTKLYYQNTGMGRSIWKHLLIEGRIWNDCSSPRTKSNPRSTGEEGFHLF